jgi:hypothetical protein
MAGTGILSTTPLDVLLDVNGDIDMSTGGPILVYGVDGVRQLCQITIAMFRGEWFLNRTVGIPYYENDYVSATVALLENKFDRDKVTSTYARELLKVPGVGKVNSLSVAFDNKTRILSVSFEVSCVFGDTVNGDVIIGAST